MAFAKFQENRFRIDGEIAENHAILVNYFTTKHGYNCIESVLLASRSNHCYCEKNGSLNITM